MAANAYYKISGKSDNSAIDSTKNSMKGLAGGLGAITTAAKTFMALQIVQVIGKAVKGIASVANATITEYQDSQKSLAILTQSVANNANLSIGALSRLTAFTKSLSGASIYDDDELNAQASYLANLGLSEEKIKKILDAASDVASSGMMPLDAAVKALNGTLTGSAGLLGKQIPDIKTLTVEQLRSGDAIDIIAGKFAGMNETMAGTLEGRTTQINNIIGNIKENIGEVFGTGKMVFLEAIKPQLEKIAAWFEENKDNVIGFFQHLPEVGAIALNAVNEMLREVFQLDFWVSYLTGLGSMWWEYMKATFELLGQAIITLGLTIWLPLRDGFLWMVWGIEEAMVVAVNFIISGIEKAINFLLSGVNLLIDGMNKIAGKEVFKQLGKVSIIRFVNEAEKPTENIGNKIGDAWFDLGKQLFKSFAAIGKAELGLFTAITKPFAPILEKATAAIKAVSVRNSTEDSPKTYLTAATAVKDAILESGKSLAAATKEITNDMVANANDKTSKFKGDARADNRADYSGNIGNSAFEALTGASGALGEVASAISKNGFELGAVMVVVNRLFGGLLQIMEPVMNSILTPILGALSVLGTYIGKMLTPILMLLSPVIELVLNAFVFLYNYAIRPYANMMIFLITTLNNVIAWAVNGIITMLNKLGLGIKWRMAEMAFDAMKLDKIQTADLYSAGLTTSASSNSGSGGNATYTGKSDTYVNIYFNNSFVNGDAREIAIALRNEINSAQALGY